MRVCIGSPGRFHTFDLAREIDRLGHLQRIYTAYPGWKVKELPLPKVSTYPWLMVPASILRRLDIPVGRTLLNRRILETFDNWMARNLEPCDILHCLSGFGTKSQMVAEDRYGALTVCDRGSSHIVYQDELLAEEHRRWRMRYESIDHSIIERELTEYENADLIFVPSTFVKRSFMEKGVSEGKLRKCPYGVNLDTFRPVRKEDRVFRVVYVGALSLRKGIPYLLEAVARLRLPNSELWLIGAALPETRPFLERYNGSYRYLGSIPRTQLYKYYSQGSVFVIASIEEGLALVQTQAMACGLPIIATANTGAEDLFLDGTAGFIVPIRSPEAIQERLLQLYESPSLREQMAEAALRRVKSLGGWSSYGEQCVAFYEDALKPR
ncbi:MAG: glycosyltransferase family 4 protein [Candidatus Binataceae bacterium]